MYFRPSATTRFTTESAMAPISRRNGWSAGAIARSIFLLLGLGGGVQDVVHRAQHSYGLVKLGLQLLHQVFLGFPLLPQFRFFDHGSSYAAAIVVTVPEDPRHFRAPAAA